MKNNIPFSGNNVEFNCFLTFAISYNALFKMLLSVSGQFLEYIKKFLRLIHFGTFYIIQKEPYIISKIRLLCWLQDEETCGYFFLNSGNQVSNFISFDYVIY